MVTAAYYRTHPVSNIVQVNLVIYFLGIGCKNALTGIKSIFECSMADLTLKRLFRKWLDF